MCLELSYAASLIFWNHRTSANTCPLRRRIKTRANYRTCCGLLTYRNFIQRKGGRRKKIERSSKGKEKRKHEKIDGRIYKLWILTSSLRHWQTRVVKMWLSEFPVPLFLRGAEFTAIRHVDGYNITQNRGTSDTRCQALALSHRHSPEAANDARLIFVSLLTDFFFKPYFWHFTSYLVLVLFGRFLSVFPLILNVWLGVFALSLCFCIIICIYTYTCMYVCMHVYNCIYTIYKEQSHYCGSTETDWGWSWRCNTVYGWLSSEKIKTYPLLGYHWYFSGHSVDRRVALLTNYCS